MAPTSDYDRELAALEREGGREDAGIDEVSKTERAGWLYRHSILTGNAEERAEAARLDGALTVVHGVIAQTEVDRLAGAGDPPSDPFLLAAARGALDVHRLEDARRWLDRVRDHDDWLAAETDGDLAVQDGRFDDAAASYAKAGAAHVGWEVPARLASLSTLRGDLDGADRLYQQAEDEVDAKAMRTFAWLEVQRGRGEFARGRFAEAQLRYDRAARAYSGYWLVEERQAELAAARGQGEQALAAYARIVERSPNPEIAQALGELNAFLGRPAAAAPWYQRALAVYKPSVDRGEVHYLHALAAFYADDSVDAAQAVHYADLDRRLRPGVAAVRDQLAWALFRAGQFDAARRESAAALAIGAPDAHTLYHAAMIALAAGRSDEGPALLQRVATLNPRYTTTFHAHH